MNQVAPADLIVFSGPPAEESTSKPAADRLLSGEPAVTTKNYYNDPAERFFAGIWESTCGRWRVAYSEFEFCHITRGRVRIESTAGTSWEFGPGASFVVPAGFEGTWDVLEPMSKLYVVYIAQEADSQI